MLNSSANSLNIISLSINSILDLVFCSFNKSNTDSKSYALMFNDFSSLINLFISIFISDTDLFIYSLFYLLLNFGCHFLLLYGVHKKCKNDFYKKR